jgi:hypothetical protein
MITKQVGCHSDLEYMKEDSSMVAYKAKYGHL